MTRYSGTSGQGPHPSRWSDAGSRGSSPPPPYSKKPPQPPPYPESRVSEHTPLLDRSGEPLTVIWEYSYLKPKTRSCLETCRGILGILGILGTLVILLVILLGFLGGIALVFRLVWLLLRLVGSILWPSPPPLPRYSVAIIGAGPAGISAAQRLRTSPAAKGIYFDITVFESGPSVGGKLAFFESEGSRVFPYNDSTLDPVSAEDIAGPALMWSNSLFTQSSERILGDEIEFFDLPSQKVGYYSIDRQFVSQATRPYGATPTWEWLDLILRYGPSVWNTGRMLGEANLGELIKDVPLKPDITKILSSMGLIGLAQDPASNTLSSRQISEGYVNEVIAPQVERGPNLRIPQMNGLSMILAAAQVDSAWAHAGGDFLERIERIVRIIGGIDIRTNSRVTEIKRNMILDNNAGAAWLVQHEGFGHVGTEAFDRVIIAAPGVEQRLAGGNTRVAGHNDSDAEIEEAIEFDPAHVALFTTSEPLRNLDPNTDEADLPPEVLYIDYVRSLHETTFVREVIRHYQGDDGTNTKKVEYLYRCISEDDLSDLLLANPVITWAYYHKLDYAYPITYPRTQYPSFRLDDGVWTTGPIHSIGDTIDLSWLAGKIVAEQVIHAAER